MVLVHDGLAFSFEGPRALLDRLTELAERDAAAWRDSLIAEPEPATPPATRVASKGSETEPAVARIHCRLQLVPLPVPAPTQPADLGWLHWEWVGDEATIWTRCARARVQRAGREFTAEAWLPADQRAVQTLMGAVCSAILHAIGGAIVHASSVQLEGGVIAFLGPSGAGKSTASLQMRQGALFSVDRLAVAPLIADPREQSSVDPPRRRRGWWAYPLFGGTLIDSRMPRALPAWAPLSAFLRVQQAPHGAFVESCSPIRALATLRESSLHGGRGTGMECEFLSRLQQLATEIPIARLHFGLGVALSPVVRHWLAETVALG